MFARRHPILFFIIMFISVMSCAFILTMALFVFGLRGIADDSDFVVSKDSVGIIEVKGVIVDSSKILESIKRFKENEHIKAIVLRVDSPGGGVAPSQEIYSEIKKAAAEKPVIASFASVAASGGYYIAAGASKIIANPGTITGSIGVIMSYTNIKELLDRIGIEPVVIKSGEFKDVPSPVKKLTEKERTYLERVSKDIHEQFIDAVCKGRNIKKEDLVKIADGRIFSGEEAKSLGLIDDIGTFEDAIEIAGKEGGIKGEINAVYSDKEKFSFLKYIKEESIQKAFSMFMNNGYFKAMYISDYR